MDVPYEIKPMGGLQVHGGQSACFKIPFIHRSVIDKFIVVQTAGQDDGFTVALYNALVACEGGSHSDSEGDVGVLPPDVYRVTPDFNSVNGRVMYFTDDNGGFGYPFFGQERSNPRSFMSASKGSPDIYLKITARGSDLKSFAVALGALTFAGG